jgi:hypothetical protein
MVFKVFVEVVVGVVMFVVGGVGVVCNGVLL